MVKSLAAKSFREPQSSTGAGARTESLGKLKEEQLKVGPKGRSIGDDASQRATEGWPEGHPGVEGNRSGDCQGQPLLGEKSGSERVNAGSGNERVKLPRWARIGRRAQGSAWARLRICAVRSSLDQE